MADGIRLPRSGTRGGRGAYGGQIRLRLEDAVPFAKEELTELREALRELGALGRNLNKLLHLLQRSDRFLEGLLDMKALSAAVERVTPCSHGDHDPRHPSGHRDER